MAVADKAEQKDAEADGWTDWHADQARMKDEAAPEVHEADPDTTAAPARRTRGPARK